MPRLYPFVPAGRILEIAPGAGRWTGFLKDLCQELILVDLSDKCIQICQEKFQKYSHIQCFVNDGSSLAMIEDNSIDFAFSFDSLVHADQPTLAAYLQELAAKLTETGFGWLHHSNMGEYSNLQQDEVIGWRSLDVSAETFRAAAEAAGLRVITQEVFPWRNEKFSDCISIFTSGRSPYAHPYKIIRNPDFAAQRAYLKQLADIYRPLHNEEIIK
jgi:SAM-dependent methyltransferase